MSQLGITCPKWGAAGSSSTCGSRQGMVRIWVSGPGWAACGPPVVSHGAMPLSSTQLSFTDLPGPALGPLDGSSARGSRQGTYSGIKCNRLHATKLVKGHHLLRGQLQFFCMRPGWRWVATCSGITCNVLHAIRLVMGHLLLRDQLHRLHAIGLVMGHHSLRSLPHCLRLAGGRASFWQVSG